MTGPAKKPFERNRGKTTSEENRTPALLREEYLKIEELASRLKLSPKTVRNKMASGIFQRGIHYLSPRGIG